MASKSNNSSHIPEVYTPAPPNRYAIFDPPEQEQEATAPVESRLFAELSAQGFGPSTSTSSSSTVQHDPTLDNCLPAKKKPGRPPGSKNKPKPVPQSGCGFTEAAKSKRQGRPRGPKNAVQKTTSSPAVQAISQEQPANGQVESNLLCERLRDIHADRQASNTHPDDMNGLLSPEDPLNPELEQALGMDFFAPVDGNPMASNQLDGNFSGSNTKTHWTPIPLNTGTNGNSMAGNQFDGNFSGPTSQTPSYPFPSNIFNNAYYPGAGSIPYYQPVPTDPFASLCLEDPGPQPAAIPEPRNLDQLMPSFSNCNFEGTGQQQQQQAVPLPKFPTSSEQVSEPSASANPSPAVAAAEPEPEPAPTVESKTRKGAKKCARNGERPVVIREGRPCLLSNNGTPLFVDKNESKQYKKKEAMLHGLWKMPSLKHRNHCPCESCKEKNPSVPAIPLDQVNITEWPDSIFAKWSKLVAEKEERRKNGGMTDREMEEAKQKESEKEERRKNGGMTDREMEEEAKKKELEEKEQGRAKRRRKEPPSNPPQQPREADRNHPNPLIRARYRNAASKAAASPSSSTNRATGPTNTMQPFNPFAAPNRVFAPTYAPRPSGSVPHPYTSLPSDTRAVNAPSIAQQFNMGPPPPVPNNPSWPNSTAMAVPISQPPTMAPPLLPIDPSLPSSAPPVTVPPNMPQFNNNDAANIFFDPSSPTSASTSPSRNTSQQSTETPPSDVSPVALDPGFSAYVAELAQSQKQWETDNVPKEDHEMDVDTEERNLLDADAQVNNSGNDAGWEHWINYDGCE